MFPFSGPFIFKYEDEIKSVFEFLETKWGFLNKTPEFNIDTIRENFENCIDIDHEDDRIKWLKKQLSYINVPPSKRRFSNSWCLTFAFDLFIKSCKII